MSQPKSQEYRELRAYRRRAFKGIFPTDAMLRLRLTVRNRHRKRIEDRG